MRLIGFLALLAVSLPALAEETHFEFSVHRLKEGELLREGVASGWDGEVLQTEVRRNLDCALIVVKPSYGLGEDGSFVFRYETPSPMAVRTQCVRGHRIVFRLASPTGEPRPADLRVRVLENGAPPTVAGEAKPAAELPRPAPKPAAPAAAPAPATRAEPPPRVETPAAREGERMPSWRRRPSSQ